MRNASIKSIQALAWAGAAALLLGHIALARAHWPGQPPHQYADLGEFEFERGGKIPNLRMSYVTHGKLNADRSNAILFMHGWGSNHHALDYLIGPGRALDTNKYFVICTDELGNSQTTFEHTTSPTNSGLKMSFPRYNGRDKVKAEHMLVTRVLGISRLLAVTGISSGAEHSLQMAVSYPDFMDGIFPIVGGALGSTQGYFYGSLYLSVIETCQGWEAGNYRENPVQCASNALSTFVPYFYSREWWERNIDTPEAYSNWRNQWGAYYLDIQDARDLYYRMMAAGSGWVGDTPGFNGDLHAVLASIKARTLFLYNPWDQFLPPHLIETQVKAIPDARAIAIDSDAGHLICCNADPQATRAMGKAIRQFLHELEGLRGAGK